MTDFDQETGEITERARSTQQEIRLFASAEVTEIMPALAKAQGAFEAPPRSKSAKISGVARNGSSYEYEYKYAPLEAIIGAVQKPLAEAGIYRQQYVLNRGNAAVLRTILWHSSGQWVGGDYPVLAEAMTGPKFAAAVTYAKRQGLSLVTGVAPEDDMDAVDAEAVDTNNPRGARPAVAKFSVVQPANGHAVNQQGDATSAMTSPGPSDTGSKIPGWIVKFLARDNYNIDPKEAGGWSSWEKFYLQVVDNTDSVRQIIKLQQDNEPHAMAFKAAVQSTVWDAFSDRIGRRKLTVEGITP